MTLVMLNPLEKSTNLLFHGHLTSERSQDNWVPTHNNSQFLKEFQHISWHCKECGESLGPGQDVSVPTPLFQIPMDIFTTRDSHFLCVQDSSCLKFQASFMRLFVQHLLSSKLDLYLFIQSYIRYDKPAYT